MTRDTREYQRQRYQEKKTDPEWLARKRERDRINRQKRRARDPEKNRAYAREWRARSKDKIADYNRQQWERIKETPDLLEKERLRNRVEGMKPERVRAERDRKRAIARQYRAKRKAQGLSSTPMYRSRERHLLDYRCYRMLREFVMVGYMGRRKTYPSFEFDSLQLVEHIGSLREPGMDWSGYGESWHIDHKRPLAKFEYTSDEDDEFKECWALSNLRPFLAAHNLSRGKRADGEWTYVE